MSEPVTAREIITAAPGMNGAPIGDRRDAAPCGAPCDEAPCDDAPRYVHRGGTAWSPPAPQALRDLFEELCSYLEPGALDEKGQGVLVAELARFLVRVRRRPLDCPIRSASELPLFWSALTKAEGSEE